MSSPSPTDLPAKGTYTLVVLLKSKIRIKVGRLGYFTFQKGYYAYTGSALSNLPSRIERHLSRRKRRHWHIDFLLGNSADISSVVAAATKDKHECNVNQMIENIENALLPVAGFGASDCKRNCKTHLVYFSDENPHRNIDAVYASLFGTAALSDFVASLVKSRGIQISNEGFS